MSSAIRRWPGVAANICAAVILCSAMQVSAQQAGGFSGKRAATIDVKESERRLQQARSMRERGRKPLSREYVIVGGARRLSENYARRQAALERELDAAERRHRETTAALQAYSKEKLAAAQ